MRFITDFADQAVILPLVVVIAVALFLQWRRGAIAWIIVVTLTFATMLVLKLGFLACSHNSLRTPSGHVAAATVVAGGLAMLLLRWRHSVLPLALLAAIVVGISRITLGAHSLFEVTVGATVGLLGASALLWTAGPVPADLKIGRIAIVAMIVMTMMHGLRLPAEAHIQSLAQHAKIVLGCT
jgi:membrane-associated phospholipid phosphatase